MIFFLLVLTERGQLDELDDGAVLGDVQEGDLALVLALVRGPDVVQPQAGALLVVVNDQLSPGKRKKNP